MTVKIETLRLKLKQLNEELAQLSQTEPLELLSQAGGSESDNLFMYGIVGGKDVGKTTLINQLAGARISIDTDILDEGTSIAVAYAYEDDLQILKKRLDPHMGGRIKYQSHNREVLKNVVLVDFPDFDSRFVAHRDDVKRLSQHLQGIVWVVTHRKYGDHEFIERLEDMAQSNRNYYIVVNKVDMLEGRVGLQTFREEVQNYLGQECNKRGMPPIPEERILLLSAQSPNEYEFSILHDRLIRVHSPVEIAKAKSENIRAEFRRNIDRMESYYQIDPKIEEIDATLNYLKQELEQRFTEEYFQTVSQRLRYMESLQRRISHGLFRQRVEDWPLLRYFSYMFSGPVSLLAGYFLSSSRNTDIYQTPRELLLYEGISASSRIQQLHLALEERLPQHIFGWQEIPDYSERVEKEFSRLLHRYEEQVVRNQQEKARKPGVFVKFLIFAPLIWFPFLQPLLFHLTLEDESIHSIPGGIMDLMSFLISLLSASALLENVIFLIVFYFIWLLGIYTYSARKVEKEGQEEFHELWFNDFLPWLQRLLDDPLRRTRAMWVEKRTALHQLDRDLKEELAQILAG
jgi:GTPase SAR1 family protein